MVVDCGSDVFKCELKIIGGCMINDWLCSVGDEGKVVIDVYKVVK